MKHLYLIVVGLITFISVAAQPGANDPTFNPNDLGFGLGEKANDIVSAITRQADGKIIIAGTFTKYDGVDRKGIARLNADGTLDETFNPGAGLSALEVYELALDANQKILVGGIIASYDGKEVNGLVRINSNGSIDDTFQVTVVLGIAYAFELLADGKILVATGTTGRLMRLNSDGTKDQSFDIGTGANDRIREITASGNKIYIGGDFTSFNSVTRSRIARLESNGQLDASFDASANERVRSIFVQTDQKILVGGDFSYLGSFQVSQVGRLNSDGSPDETFHHFSFNLSVFRAIALTSGKVLIAGTPFDNGYPGIYRLSATGEKDTDFNGSGESETQYFYDALEEPDGNVVVVGYAPFKRNGETRNGIIRIKPDGTVHDSFAPSGTGANGAITKMVSQSDGKVIIAGAFSYYDGVKRNRIARLNADGTLDETFNPAGPNGEIHAMVIQANGKILIGGNFSTFNGAAHNRIVRLNASGTIDDAFSPPDYSNAYAEYHTIGAIALLSGGKILLGGSFNLAVDAVAYMVRLNENGSIDDAFSTVDGFNNSVTCIAPGSGDKIYVGGDFSKYGQTSRLGILRLNTNGTLDTTFDPGTGFYAGLGSTNIFSIDLQTDGKIIVAGDFYSFNGTDRKGVARLNENGSLDTSFKGYQNGYDRSVQSVNVLADGKIILGGFFNYYADQPRYGLVRVNSDGTIDPSFTVGTGFLSTNFDGPVLTTLVLADGKILVGGNFTSYAGTGRNRIARVLKECGSMLTLGKPDVSASKIVCEFLEGTLTVENNTLPHGAEWKWYSGSCDGELLATGTSLLVQAQPKSYFVKAVGGCISTSECAEIAVTVQSKPTIVSTVPGGTCGSGSVEIGATPSAGTISWYENEFGSVSVGTGNTFTTPVLDQSKSYYAEANSNGCISGRLEVLAQVSTEAPLISSSTGGSQCGEGIVTLSASASQGKVNWYATNESTTILKTGTSFETPTLTATTSFFAEADNGCKSTRTAVVATIKPIPVVALQTSGSVITATVTGSTAPPTYKWVICSQDGTNINGDVTSVSYNASENRFDGSYAVIVTADGCSKKSDCVTIVGMEDFSMAGVNVFPNPSKGNFFVDLPGNGAKEIVIHDAAGKSIFTATSEVRGLFEVDIPGFLGIAIISIKTTERVHHSKIIVE